MVSFQCDACTDVVKKPKLDQHRSICHSSFTCIDCSTTFDGPAQYKSHTSCISEAEKYQKSVYKGPRNGNRQNGHNPRSNENANAKADASEPTTNGIRESSTNGHGKYPHQRPSQDQAYSRPSGYGRGGGGYGRGGGRGGYGGYGYVRSSATGANDTPLGSPARMSPVTTPVSEDAPAPTEPAKSEMNGKGKEKGSKRKSEEVVANGGEPLKKKSKASKDHSTPTESASTSAPPIATQLAPTVASSDIADPKSKKSKKKSNATDGEQNDAANGEHSAEGKHSKRKGKKAGVETEMVVVETAVEGVSGEKKSKKDKKKKEKKEKAVEPAVAERSVEDEGGEVRERKKDKKNRKKEIDVALGGDEENGASEDKSEQKKKRKREETEATEAGDGKVKRKEKKRKSSAVLEDS